MSSTTTEVLTDQSHLQLKSYLDVPFKSDKLLQVRTGKIKPYYNLPQPSAIFKNPRQDNVEITKLGCEGDEQAFEEHGGPDKALLHYCAQHYPEWQKEIPQAANKCKTGAFGENLVSNVANEFNVCIGDVMSVGDEVLLQVSEPRQPCFKLNHRFQIKDMSRRTQDKRRTGWYYRVLRTGSIKAGDEIKLVSRSHEKWTVAAVQHYLHKEMRNTEAMQELVNIPELGESIKMVFENRLKKNFEDVMARLAGGEANKLEDKWIEYKIVGKKKETRRICSFVLEAMNPPENAENVKPGSHVRLKLPGKLMRAYSVVGGTSKKFELGVALEPDSRGGSRYMHEVAKVGDVVSASQIVSSFPFSPNADHHVLIAGGIGITAFLSGARTLQKAGQPYKFHLAVRSADEVPFKNYLDELGESVTVHDKAAGKALDLKAVISKATENTHIYCCGPTKLMDGVTTVAKDCGVPPANVHFEAFSSDTSGDPFTVEVANHDNKKLEISGNKTLLEVLRDAGIDMPSSCEVGNCGTCQVRVCSGKVDHRGTALMDSEKETMMLSCVSRGVGQITIEV